MKQSDYVAHLFEILDLMEESGYWLNRSFQSCIIIGIKNNYSDEEYDLFEALKSRFARLCDILIQQVYRSSDMVELETGGTMIDRLNRAEKRELIDSIDEVREIRELRNSISHEYLRQDLIDIFHSTLEYTPRLFALISRSREYCKKFGYNGPG